MFSNSFKSSYVTEKYIDVQLGYKELKRTAKFRMNSHKYNIKTGRKCFKYGNVINRICGHCSTNYKKYLAKFLRRFHIICFPEDDAKEPAAKVPPNSPAAQA